MSINDETEELKHLRILPEDAEALEDSDTKATIVCSINAVKPERKKWRLILEPVLLCGMLSINLGLTSLQNLYLLTACSVDLGIPRNVCESGDGEEFLKADEASQQVLSSLNISRAFIGYVISTVLLLFVGPWSDCSGRRKPLLVMALLGMTVMTVAALFVVTFPGASTVDVLYAVQIPFAFGGGYGLLLTASYSYVGDICDVHDLDVSRSMGTHSAAYQLADLFGTLGGSVLYRYSGYYGVFAIILALQVFCIIYVLLTVKDVNVNQDNKVSVFSWKLPLDAFKCLVKRRAGYRRSIILLMALAMLCDRVVLAADMLLAYLFFRRKYNWDDILFGVHRAFRNTFNVLGTFLILNVLKQCAGMSDETIGFYSGISAVLTNVGLVLAPNTLVVFIVAAVGIISQGSLVVRRPILNKQIKPSEQGKIYGVMASLESATQMITSPLYALLYAETVSSFPDAWLLPCIAMAVLQSIIYLWSKWLWKKTESADRPGDSPTKARVDDENANNERREKLMECLEER